MTIMYIDNIVLRGEYMKKRITTALFPVATLLYSGCGNVSNKDSSISSLVNNQASFVVNSSKKSVLYSVSKVGEDEPIYEGKTLLNYSQETKISGTIPVTDDLKKKIDRDSVYIVKTTLEEDSNGNRESRSLHSVIPSDAIENGSLSVNILLDAVYENIKDDLKSDIKPQEVEAITDEHSESVLKDIDEGGDVNRDGEVNAEDLLDWDPEKDIDKLKKDFKKEIEPIVENMKKDNVNTQEEANKILEAPDLSNTSIAVSSPKTSTTDYAIKGVRYLNRLRSDAGMINYNSEQSLQQAAQMHSKYNVANNVMGHYERAGDAYFTGVTVDERVSLAGYSSSFVGENVSSGTNQSVQESIDGLFSAIYHRLGFLNFEFNEIGIGMDKKDSRVVYTYNAGAKDSTNNMQNNPELVVWPYENQDDSLPAFYEESPDPLPECGVSGYPISIQFNPAYVDGVVSVNSFKLYQTSSNQEITNVKLMNKESDHNHHITENEFVLFPMNRLDWNTNYHAVIEYVENGVVKNKKWSFKTRSLPSPNYTVTNSGESFDVKSGTSYFYLPPNSCNDFFNSINTSSSGNLSIKTSFVDFNTLRLDATGSGSITITPSNGRTFSVNVQ